MRFRTKKERLARMHGQVEGILHVYDLEDVAQYSSSEYVSYADEFMVKTKGVNSHETDFETFKVIAKKALPSRWTISEKMFLDLYRLF